jgi:ATP-binding cassette, subfamily B, multidrug efflux pump
MKGIKRTFPYLAHYWLTALAALVSLLLVNAANLYTPQLLRQLIDNGIYALNLNLIWYTAGLIVVIALVRGLFNFLQGYLSEKTSQGVAYEMRNEIFERLQHLSFSYHDQSQTGKLMTHMTSDVEMVRMFTGNGLLQLISAIVLLIGTLIILFSMNALLTLIFLAMIPPIAVIFGFFIKTLLPRSRIVQERLEKLNSLLQENLAGVRVVKAFAREDHERDRFFTRNQDLLNENITLLGIFATFFPMIFFIANIAVVGVLWVGGLEVITGGMTLGELVAFIGYQGFFLMPIFMLGFVGSVISRAEASAQRIFEVIDAKSEVTDKPDAIEAPRFKGHVVFNDVSFRYAGGEAPVIEEISFEALPNQTVAIMGRTGSGKSSIINLIPRFYDVSSGKVSVDGYDVRDLTLSSLRSQIGIVLQETTLFTGTIRENIAYGRMDASMEDIVAVAKAAQAHDFITAFEEGYETVVGERGVGLSGGQKQRIAIARALLLSPRILIMDDSTSSVDAETEYKIQQALDMLRQGRTTFVIAQRISTVRSADLILLLDEGRLVGKGTHAELLDCCEIYTEILATQFGDRSELQAAVEEALQ